MKSRLSLAVLVATAGLLLSCEYDTDEVNYVKVEPPSDTHLFQLNIADVGENEQIYIYDRTGLYYQLAGIPEGVEPSVSWSLNGDPLNEMVWSTEPNFVIDPSRYGNGDYTLKVAISMRSNTGSLADILGMEGYAGERTFRVRIACLTEADKNLNIRQEISADRRLKIVWDKPGLQQLEVEKYTVTYWDQEAGWQKTVDVTDPDQTEWVDPYYVNGEQNLVVSAHFKNEKIAPWKNRFQVVSPAFSADFFVVEDVGGEQVRISLKPYPYRADYLLANYSSGYSEYVLRLEEADFPITLDRPEFPGTLVLNSGIYAPQGERCQSNGIQVRIGYPLIASENAWSCIASTFDRLLLLPGDGVTEVVNADGFAKISDFAASGLVCCDPGSSRKLILSGKTLYLFKDGSLTQPAVVETAAGNIYCVAYAPGNLIYLYWWYSDYGTYHSRLWALDADSGEYLYTVDLPDFKNYLYPQLSADGRYLSLYDEGALVVYGLSGPTAKRLHSFVSEEVGVDQLGQIHPTIPHLFIHYTNSYNTQVASTITLYELPEMRAVQTINGRFATGDPFTGNLMYHRSVSDQAGTYVISDPTMQRELYVFSRNEGFGGSLINHCLVGSGKGVCYLDISDHLIP